MSCQTILLDLSYHFHNVIRQPNPLGCALLAELFGPSLRLGVGADAVRMRLICFVVLC